MFKHKLAHHKTWLCKEVAPTLVELEPRRKLSSNVFHMPTIPESEDGGEGDFASKRVSKPSDQSEGSEGAGTFASKRVSKPHDQGEGDGSVPREEEEGDILKGEVRTEEELNLTSGSVAPQVMIYQAQHNYPKYLKVFCCDHCQEPFPSKSGLKNHLRRNCKGVEVHLM